MEEEDKDIFFVEVQEPDEVRRNILESSKEIVESLERFEKFKGTRKEKMDNINKLGKIVKDINKLAIDLKNSLPESLIKAMKVSKPEIIEKKKLEERAERKPISELQKLHAELSEIESKLQSLS